MYIYRAGILGAQGYNLILEAPASQPLHPASTKLMTRMQVRTPRGQNVRMTKILRQAT